MGRKNGKQALDRKTLPRVGGGADDKKCGVLVGIPTRGRSRIEFATTLRMMAEPFSTTWGIRTVTGEQIDTARNALVRVAREEGSDYLFFLDDDTLCPPQTLFKLQYEMQQRPHVDVITAIVPTRSDPPVPTIFNHTEGYHTGPYWDWEFGQVFEITACGFAATLVRVSAFDKVKAPWFLNTRGRVNGKEGEDAYFCHRLREAGGHVFADGSLLCGHIAENGTVYQLKGTERPFRNVDMKKLTPAGSVEV